MSHLIYNGSKKQLMLCDWLHKWPSFYHKNVDLVMNFGAFLSRMEHFFENALLRKKSLKQPLNCVEFSRDFLKFIKF